MSVLTGKHRVLTWKTRTGNRTVHIPLDMLHRPLLLATYHTHVPRHNSRNVRHYIYLSPRSISDVLWSHSYGITPEVLWGTLHGLVGFGLAMWWQITVQMAQMVQKVQ